jgi:two-component system response regulator HydG/two-component system response regulator AtoC
VTRETPLVGGERLIGETPAIRAVRTCIAQFASVDSNVLIMGETGTGKELVAELIHRNSSRGTKPLIAVNCAAIPDTLLENELFGHERGAFTGAGARQAGLLQIAHGGTVFLDEIGDMTLQAQAKILRAVEAKEVQRLGGRGTVPVDIRIVAATNQDLQRLVSEGRFRRDLYFRLSVARIDLPPLRDRRADIPLLVTQAIGDLNHQFGQSVAALSEHALDHLLAHDWPGNIRELKHLLEAVYVMGPPSVIGCEHLPAWFTRQMVPGHPCEADDRARLLWALRETNWNKSRAAQRLRISRMTLYRKLVRYHLTDVDHAREAGA